MFSPNFVLSWTGPTVANSSLPARGPRGVGEWRTCGWWLWGIWGWGDRRRACNNSPGLVSSFLRLQVCKLQGGQSQAPDNGLSGEEVGDEVPVLQASVLPCLQAVGVAVEQLPSVVDSPAQAGVLADVECRAGSKSGVLHHLLSCSANVSLLTTETEESC